MRDTEASTAVCGKASHRGYISVAYSKTSELIMYA